MSSISFLKLLDFLVVLKFHNSQVVHKFFLSSVLLLLVNNRNEFLVSIAWTSKSCRKLSVFCEFLVLLFAGYCIYKLAFYLHQARFFSDSKFFLAFRLFLLKPKLFNSPILKVYTFSMPLLLFCKFVEFETFD